MKVTAARSTSFMLAMMLLISGVQRCCCADETDGVVLHVDPDRLQFYEFEPITFKCVGPGAFRQWRVRRMLQGQETICGSMREETTGPCHINHAFEIDGGEYWCETDEGVRSRSVNISITAGPVILGIPALPVTKGENVTLSCMNRTTPSAVAHLYKDGIPQGGDMTIYNVSESDEGFYKCNIPGVGESAESWLEVRAVSLLPTEGLPASKEEASKVVITGTLSVLSLLLLSLSGLCFCRKHRDLICESWQSLRSRCPTCETEAESAETSEEDAERNTDSWTQANIIYSCESRGQKISSVIVSEDSRSSSDDNLYYCSVD